MRVLPARGEHEIKRRAGGREREGAAFEGERGGRGVERDVPISDLRVR